MATEKAVGRPRRLRCCNLFHVKTVAITIAVIEILYILYWSAFSFSALVSSSSSLLSPVISLVVLLLSFISVVLLFSGIQWQLPHLLIPHMLMQSFLVVTAFACALSTLYALFLGTSLQFNLAVGAIDSQPQTWTQPTKRIAFDLLSRGLIMLLIFVTFGYIILGVVNIWCFHVIVDCYRWLASLLDEKASALDSCTTTTNSSRNGHTTHSKDVEEGTDL